MKNVWKLVAGALALSSGSALAQDFSMPMPDYIGGWSSTHFPDIVNDQGSGGTSAVDLAREEAKERKSGKVGASSPSSLIYAVSQERRFANQKRLLANMGGNEALGNVSLVDEVDRLMRPIGLRADNMADAYSMWWVAAWYAANQQQGVPSTAMRAAAKKQAEAVLGAVPQLTAATDTQKQEIAESWIIQAALIDAHRDSAKDDPDKLAALAKEVNDGSKQAGMDLTKMNLSDAGFRPR